MTGVRRGRSLALYSTSDALVAHENDHPIGWVSNMNRANVPATLTMVSGEAMFSYFTPIVSVAALYGRVVIINPGTDVTFAQMALYVADGSTGDLTVVAASVDLASDFENADPGDVLNIYLVPDDFPALVYYTADADVLYAVGILQTGTNLATIAGSQTVAALAAPDIHDGVTPPVAMGGGGLSSLDANFTGLTPIGDVPYVAIGQEALS